MFFFVLVIVCISVSTSSMELPKDGRKLCPMGSDKRITKLKNMADGRILYHLIRNDLTDCSFSLIDTTKNVITFFSLNKTLRIRSKDPIIAAYLLHKLTSIYNANWIYAASCLPILGSRNFLTQINMNQKYERAYEEELKEAAMDPSKLLSLKGLVACDQKGLAWQGLPRISALMIAVGYKNEAAVNCLISAAQKKERIAECLNYVTPAGTTTKLEIFNFPCPPPGVFDTDLDFVCFHDYTALHVAALQRNGVQISILEKLLAAGANPNAGEQTRCSPLGFIFNSDDYKEEVAALLLARGAKNVPTKLILKPEMINLMAMCKKQKIN